MFARQHPCGRPLEQVEALGAGHQRDRELRRGRSGADHADLAAVERYAMIPSRRVEAGALERFEALELGDVRVVENAGRGNHQVETVAIAGGGGPRSEESRDGHECVSTCSARWST